MFSRLARQVPLLCQQNSSFGATLSQRQLSVSSCHRVKSINVKEEGNKIIVNGEYKPSPREKYLAKGFVVPSGGSRCECCLCKLGLQIKHTDVLILEQFTNSKGKQLPRDVTGLCKEQHKRLDYLLVMAEKAGLISVYAETGKRELTGWEQYNKYYDDNMVEELVKYKLKKLY